MNKKNLVLGGVLVLLIALAYLYDGPFREWRADWGKPDNFLARLDTEKINNIEITYAGASTTLEKSGDKWKIAGTKEFYVSEDTSIAMISGLKEAAEAETELVSENADKKDEFGTGESGARIRLRQGGEVLMDFIVGRPGSDYQSSYIAEPDTEKTYAVKTNLSSVFARGDWYDKIIFSSDIEKITKIRFQYPTREFTVEKKDGIWAGVLPSAFGVSEEKIAPVLEIMSGLAAADIPEQTFAGTGLEKNSIIIQATGEGIDNVLMVGDKNGEELYYAKKGTSDNIYLISEEQGDELNKRSGDLR